MSVSTPVPVPKPRLPPRSHLPGFLQTAAVLWFTQPYVCAGLRRHDSPTRFKVLGIGEYVSVWDPEQVKQLFTADRDGVHAGEANARVLGRAVPTGLIVLDGDRHLRMRRLLSPPFHGEAVRGYTTLIDEVAAAAIDSWPLGEAFALLPRFQAITLEVIIRAVIGASDPARLERLREVLGRVAAAGVLTNLAEVRYPKLADSRLGRRLPWLRARREADAVLYEEIATARAVPAARDDVLALLLQARDEDGSELSDGDLRDQLMTLLIAGHETTATALAWCFERLLRNPEALAWLLEDPDDAHLEATINETLRLRAPVDGATRLLTEPLQIGGYLLPAGTTIIASIIGAGLSEQYEDPVAFKPWRFLEQPPSTYSLIAFGGGPRRCLGASFAMLEMKRVLRAVLERLELRPAGTKPERAVRTRRLTVFPAKGTRVLALPRTPRPSGTASAAV